MPNKSKDTSGFKLLAIRPLKGCEESYKKRLLEGEFYKFYQGYRFLDEKGVEISEQNDNVNQGVYKVVPPEDPLNLYSKGELTINISAVVGENGSGKSSLIELFFLALFVKSSKTSILNLRKKIVRTKNSITRLETDIKILEGNLGPTIDKADLDIYKSSVLKIEALRKQKQGAESHLEKLKEASDLARNNKLRLEIFIEIGNEIQMISFYPRNFRNKSKIKEFLFVPDHITDLFYTISLNYSLYGLNALEIGSWIEMLFHKNDGYLTPVVINPMRTNGQIDINKENYLAQNRILANLVDYKLKQKEIVDGKIIDEILFSIPTKKLENCDFYFESFPVLENSNGKDVTNFVKIEKGAYKLFINEKKIDILKFFDIGDDLSISLKGVDPSLIKKYISQKLFKIARTYTEYSRFYSIQDSGTERIDDFETFISDLIKDRTHKTLKLRQLINVIKYGVLSNRESKELEIIYGIEDGSDIKWKEGKLRLRFSDYSKIIRHAYNKAIETTKKEGELELMEFIPNAFFEPQVSFKGEAGFRSLSSGEQQYYNAINTIVYHVLNLDSIPNHFNRVNVIFDEIELYFHPEFQRRFISDLIKSLRNLDLANIKEFNIVFSTHSPFILSDIPSSNILRLKKGEPQKNPNQTFAANIYDILKDDFFLEDGVVGEFASEKIAEVLEGRISNEESCLKIIEIIGDPLLKSVVAEKFSSRIKEENVLEEQIKKLQNQLNNIRNASDKRI